MVGRMAGKTVGLATGRHPRPERDVVELVHSKIVIMADLAPELRIP